MNQQTTQHHTNDHIADLEEREFVQTLPHGQWLLVRVEPPKKQSSIIEGLETASAFVKVLAVGPDFKGDVQPGDRITYAERMNLPKELGQTRWAKNYAWIHENKILGRFPRNSADKRMLPSLTQAAMEDRMRAALADQEVKAP